ncbi:MAG: helix-turn-helix transcriptional regulator [Mycobacterium sp.]
MSRAKPDLIGSSEACTLLGISRATLTRGVLGGEFRSAAKLPGPNGAYLFERRYIESLAAKREASKSVAS